MNKFIGSFLALLLLLAGPSPVLAHTGVFSDIQEHWAQNEIEATCNLGLMKGMGSDEQGVRFFSPENTLSRAQLAMVLVTTFNLDYGNLVEPPLVNDYYRNIDNDDWYAEAALLCAVNQIFEPAEYFIPNKQ